MPCVGQDSSVISTSRQDAELHHSRSRADRAPVPAGTFWTDSQAMDRSHRVVHLIRIIGVFLKIYSFTIIKKNSTVKVEMVAATGTSGALGGAHLGRGHDMFPTEDCVASEDRCCWQQASRCCGRVEGAGVPGVLAARAAIQLILALPTSIHWSRPIRSRRHLRPEAGLSHWWRVRQPFQASQGVALGGDPTHDAHALQPPPSRLRITQIGPGTRPASSRVWPSSRRYREQPGTSSPPSAPRRSSSSTSPGPTSGPRSR